MLPLMNLPPTIIGHTRPVGIPEGIVVRPMAKILLRGRRRMDTSPDDGLACSDGTFIIMRRCSCNTQHGCLGLPIDQVTIISINFAHLQILSLNTILTDGICRLIEPTDPPLLLQTQKRHYYYNVSIRRYILRRRKRLINMT